MCVPTDENAEITSADSSAETDQTSDLGDDSAPEVGGFEDIDELFAVGLAAEADPAAFYDLLLPRQRLAIPRDVFVAAHEARLAQRQVRLDSQNDDRTTFDFALDGSARQEMTLEVLDEQADVELRLYRDQLNSFPVVTLRALQEDGLWYLVLSTNGAACCLEPLIPLNEDGSFAADEEEQAAENGQPASETGPYAAAERFAEHEIVYTDGSTLQVTVEVGPATRFGTYEPWEFDFDRCALDLERDAYLPLKFTLTNTTAGFDLVPEYQFAAISTTRENLRMTIRGGDCGRDSIGTGQRLSEVFAQVYNNLQPDAPTEFHGMLILTNFFTPATPEGAFETFDGSLEFKSSSREALFSGSTEGFIEGAIPVIEP